MRTLLVAVVVVVAGSGVLAPQAAQAALANDLFANATVLTGPAGTTSGSTVGASFQEGEEFENYGASPSVWFRWTAPDDLTVAFDLCASSFDTTLDIYIGDALDTLTSIATNNDGCSNGSEGSLISFAASAGQTYQIRVSGYFGASGFYVLAYPSDVPVPVDSDGDGLSDEEDPDTVAVVVADPTVKITAGNRKAFLGRLDEVERLILAGDVSSATTELGSLRKRVDGCSTSSPKADKNDWITDCASQLEIRARIDDLIAALSA